MLPLFAKHLGEAAALEEQAQAFRQFRAVSFHYVSHQSLTAAVVALRQVSKSPLPFPRALESELAGSTSARWSLGTVPSVFGRFCFALITELRIAPVSHQPRSVYRALSCSVEIFTEGFYYLNYSEEGVVSLFRPISLGPPAFFP